jgi:hypothetical protein
MSRNLKGGPLLAVVVGGLFTAGVPACSLGTATARDEIATSSSALQNGSVDSTHTYAVGLRRSQGHAIFTCSGTLIAPNLVLTARHCVSELSRTSQKGVNCSTDTFGATYAASTIAITTSKTFDDADKAKNWVAGSKVLVPSGNAGCGSDVSLIILAKSIPSSEAKPVDPAIDHFMTEHQIYSINYAAIGYGNTAPDTSTSGTRHFAEGLRITCLRGSSAVDCWTTATNPPSATSILESEFLGADGVCSGDSGGGAYEQMTYTAGSPKVVGVAARAGESNGLCVGGIYERVDHQRDFLISGATQAASLGGYAVPAWTLSAAPSDAGAPAVNRDAGATTSDAGTTLPPAKVRMGDPCDTSDQCATNMCAAEAADLPFTCTTACEADDMCPSGFSCRAGICLVGPASVAEVITTTTTTGWSTADPSMPIPWRGSVTFILGLGLFAARTRQRGRSRPS